MHNPAQSHLEALKCVYDNTLYVVDNLRLFESLLAARGIALNETEAEALHAAFESIADAQQAIEAVVPAKDR